MSEEDDEEDPKVETGWQDLVSPGECLQCVLVEEGEERFGRDGNNSRKDCQEGEGFTDLIGLHELGHVRAGRGGDAVPEHVEDVAEVESPQLAEQGGAELADDGAGDGHQEDGRVSPLQVAAQKGHQDHLTEQLQGGLEGGEVTVAAISQEVLQPVEQVVDSPHGILNAQEYDEYRGKAEDIDSGAIFSLLKNCFNPSNGELGYSFETT